MKRYKVNPLIKFDIVHFVSTIRHSFILSRITYNTVSVIYSMHINEALIYRNMKLK